ncbi:MAG: hypothetical protein Q7T03_02550 [Deltaproteobacteria bacterium]|nr:hypothetical protein [Deltaproteobacteria bacterium]
MDFQGVRPDLVKYEMRQTTGTPAWQKDVKKPGAFGRFLSGVGKFFGAVAAPLSFIFPPAALAAAGMYGAGAIGDQVQAKSYQRQMETQAQKNPQNISFPGLDAGGVGGIQPASSSGVSPQGEMVMNVLFSRDDAASTMAHSL